MSAAAVARQPVVALPAPRTQAIVVNGLKRLVRDPMTRRRRWVLRGIDFTVEQGEVFGFLGVNGAGKTTTLECLIGLIDPSGGSVTVCGGDPRDPEVRRRVGFLPERPNFYDFVTPVEFLDLVGRLCDMDRPYRRRRTEELLTQLHLEAKASTPLRKLSKGQLQRLGVAQAVIQEPELLILDEPMSGLDPRGRRDVRDLVEEVRGRGGTVVFSSHVVPDVESLCDRVAILHHGELLNVGRIDEITSVRLHEIDVTLRDTPLDLIERLVGPSDDIQVRGNTVLVRVRDLERVDRLVVRVLQAGGRLLTLERRRERLEDYLVRTASLREAAS